MPFTTHEIDTVAANVRSPKVRAILNDYVAERQALDRAKLMGFTTDELTRMADALEHMPLSAESRIFKPRVLAALRTFAETLR